VWRRRRGQDDAPKGALRRLFSWRVDPEPSARVPLTASPDAMLREPAVQREGRPGQAMAAMYCARCGRPNPEGARYCSNCGAQLARSAGSNPSTGSFSAIPSERGGETTSIISVQFFTSNGEDSCYFK
jgi:hypothetical protein